MSYQINDYTLIEEITKNFYPLALELKDEKSFGDFEHPLDLEVKDCLLKLQPAGKELFEYSQVSILDDLWVLLVKKSISCLRLFDSREPFGEDKAKRPIAYGMDRLQEYHRRYTEFEGLLYGSSSLYRDHIFHAIRTWMLGTFCLLVKITKESNERFITHIEFDGESNGGFSGKLDFFEKISMWTIISLCHDLGYPLEKSQNILDKTKIMMREFIQNPNIWHNFGFSGVQDNINDYIIRFMSTKMKPAGEDKGQPLYFGRIQPKYYLKYTKSLDKFDHGIVSAVIIYKMLLYFVESDFNLNDDYTYTLNDARQFYIRREMLRAMSSHTCSDIYNIHLATFSSLLFFCDELQEWGRKSWNALYGGLLPDAINLTIFNFSPSSINVMEDVDMTQIHDKEVICKNVALIYERQYSLYKLILRDGQYTNKRTINFEKVLNIRLKTNGATTNHLSIEYAIRSTGGDYFSITTNAPSFDFQFDQYFQKMFGHSDHFHECRFS